MARTILDVGGEGRRRARPTFPSSPTQLNQKRIALNRSDGLRVEIDLIDEAAGGTLGNELTLRTWRQ